MFPAVALCLLVALLSRVSSSPVVLQTEAHLTPSPGDTVTLRCSMAAGLSMSSYTMYWYRQARAGAPIEFLKKEYDTSGETERFSVSLATAENRFDLRVSNLTLADAAAYYCAASTGLSQPAYFGNGTKLTVLESGIEVTRPKVKVLPPSNREGCKKTNRTLVCVATGFYPDHITVSWKVNGVEVTSGVRTDDTALRDEDNRFYSITSRLRVSYRKWFDTRSTFTCLTSFYNGKISVEDKDSIKGVNGGGMDREYLLKSGLTAKLSYSVFIAKSFLYGLFVSAVVWKIRSSVAKRYD